MTRLDIEVGEVVVPKSGGPRMTVESVFGSQVCCVWVSGGRVHQHIFLAETLKRVKKKP